MMGGKMSWVARAGQGAGRDSGNEIFQNPLLCAEGWCLEQEHLPGSHFRQFFGVFLLCNAALQISSSPKLPLVLEDDWKFA